MGPIAATRTDLGSCRLGNWTFGKLLLGKIPLGSCHLEKNPLGKNLISNIYTIEQQVAAFGLGSVGLLRLYCTIHKCPDQGNKARKVNFGCISVLLVSEEDNSIKF